MDVQQIDNILSNDDKEIVQFSDAQWLYLQDNNNNQYNNFIQFITTQLKQQFIDYYNAFFWIPMRLEFANAAAQIYNLRPPAAAFRESVLSLITNLIISTDQGQTIVNDVNTQFINNLRLKIENNFDWVHCEGSELDFGYDQFTMLPSTTTTTNLQQTGYQVGPSFLAPTGQALGAINSAPITNDFNEFGNNQLGTFTVTVGTNAYTQFNGVNFIAAGQVSVTFPDGRIGSIPYTSSTTLTSFGGIVLADYTVAGTYNLQATGTTSVLNNPAAGEIFTVPVVITTGAWVSIGGVTQTNTNGTYNVIAANGQIGARNPNFNKGFLDRVTIFQNSSAYQYIAGGSVVPSGNTNTNGTHVYWTVAKIPLKLLHDFFLQLNLPIINIGFNFQLYLAQTNGANPSVVYPPIETGLNVGLQTGGLDATPRPSIYYGQSLSGGGGCRLYYRSVKFSPADTARMAQKLTTGFTKSIKFTSCDWLYPSSNIISATGSPQVQQQLTQSTVHPQRVWALGYPNNVNLNGSPVTGQGSFLQSIAYSTGVIPGFFTQVNINVNNIPYFRQNFQTATDLWNQVKEQFNPDTGSMLRYIDWLNYARYICLDLTRIADRLQSPTEPVSLTFVGTRSDGLLFSLEMIYLVERQNQITFRFSSSDVAIVVGNLD